MPTPQTIHPISAKVPLVGLAGDYEQVHSKPHRHERGQLYYCEAGALRVEANGSIWLVAPNRGVWIPPGVEHKSYSHRPVRMSLLYVAKACSDELPQQVCIVNTSPLLHELVKSAAEQKRDWSEHSEAYLAQALLEQMQCATKDLKSLPMPRDSRALEVCKYLAQQANRDTDVDKICMHVGLSRRTFLRLMQKETQLNIHQWSQQMLILRAVEFLIDGLSITDTALEIGYSNPSAFSRMFRRGTGVSPTYFQAIGDMIENFDENGARILKP